MTKKTFITLLLLVAIYPINEIHTEFASKSDVIMNNWWSGYDYPLSLQWYVKYLCADVSNIIKALIIFRLSRLNQVLRLVAAVYLALTMLDLVFFFVDCNTGNYLLLYSCIGLFALIIACPKRIKYRREYSPENTVKI